jgi:phosphate acyltransferase
MVSEKRPRIALDVMGSDAGIAGIVQGGLDAAGSFPDLLDVVLVGRQEQIEAALGSTQHLPDNVTIQHAETEVPMHISATDGARMRDSSISVGLKLVKESQADAFVSPGNTGAVMASSLLTLGRIRGVARPAITSIFPTWTGRSTVVLDVGANADCKPLHLSQFAIMGSVYAQVIFNHEAPRVGLLSIGEERSKGNELIFNARKLLSDSKINFIGNIEGRDILSGMADVAVTDGFTGNIILKFAESLQPMLAKSMQRQVQTNIFSRVGATLLLPFLRRMKQSFDYAESGGAPLLGVNGVVIICHGSSNARAILNAIRVAHEMVSKRVLERTQAELETNHFGRDDATKEKRENNRDGIVYSEAASDER